MSFVSEWASNPNSGKGISVASFFIGYHKTPQMRSVFYYSLLILASVASLSSCTSDYTQIAYIGTTNTDVTKQNNFWVYENDTIRVVYSFWDEKGIMSFMIYNKSDKPLYIDWKKSSLISESKKVPYYSNKVVNTYSGKSTKVSAGWVSIFNSFASGHGATSAHFSGESVVVKSERVTFIPPKSYVFKGFYDLVANIYFDIQDRNTVRATMDGVKVYVTTTKSGNKVEFRNFLTYSTDEEFKQEWYVDNGFYVKKVVTMKDEDFLGALLPGDGVNYEYPYMSPTRFYIDDLSKEILFNQQNGN